MVDPALVYAGAALQVYGAWSIDFAHLAWEQNRPTVGVPGPWGIVEFDRAFFWNQGFFIGILGGTGLVLAGALPSPDSAPGKTLGGFLADIAAKDPGILVAAASLLLAALVGLTFLPGEPTTL
mgnify:CR=1 FL=1